MKKNQKEALKIITSNLKEAYNQLKILYKQTGKQGIALGRSHLDTCIMLMEKESNE